MGDTQLELLLIEDNPGDVRLIEELLDEAVDHSSWTVERTGGEGIDIQHAASLEEGLHLLDTASIDVVLLDLGLPDSTGIATLESVLEASQRVAVVVLTGLDDERIGVQAVSQGAQEYLVKDELAPMLLWRSIRHAIERKKFERTQRALHSASRELIQAESPREVSQLVVDTAVDVLDLPAIVIYRFDESANELQPIAHTDYIEDRLGEIPAFGPGDGSITWHSFINGETITLEDALDLEHIQQHAPALESGIWIPLGDHGVISVVSEEDAKFDPQTRELTDHLAATAEAALERVAHEAALREHERELTHQNEQLESLNRMNEVIRDIDQALIEASTRDAIEQAVCDRLTQNERFAFAWIGNADEEELQPRAWAGTGREYLDSISLATDVDDGPPAVTTRTAESVTLVSNVAANLRDASWRKAALANDLQSVISIPLSYNDLNYGVLTVFASDPGTFDARSKAMFEELGETIANAINADETRQVLLTDRVVELELAISEPDDLLGRLARDADCQIEYSGIVPQSDGTTRLFFTASGTSPDEIRAVGNDMPEIQRLEYLGEGDDDENRFEMTASEPTIPWTIVECGAVAQSIEIARSTTHVVVELPGTSDVRTFIDRLEATYPDIELIARRDRERTNRSKEAFETALTGALTQRQLETLQTAYHSGYFEWPRDRTGEEVAESLGIKQPTFNGHLRAAERKLCALLFEENTTPPR